MHQLTSFNFQCSVEWWIAKKSQIELHKFQLKFFLTGILTTITKSQPISNFWLGKSSQFKKIVEHKLTWLSRRWRNNLIYIFFAAFTLKPFHQNSPSLLLLAFILIIFNPSYCLLVAGCLSEASLRMLIIFIIFRSRCSVGLLTAKFISVLRNLILWRDSDSQIFYDFPCWY